MPPKRKFPPSKFQSMFSNKSKHYRQPPQHANLGDYGKRNVDRLLEAMKFKQKEERSDSDDEVDRPKQVGFREKVIYGTEDLKKGKTSHSAKGDKLMAKIHDEIANEKTFAVRPLLEPDEKDTYEDMHFSDIIEKHPFRGMVVGQSGTGKTVAMSYLINMVFSKYFDEIHVMSPNVWTDPEWKGCLLEPKNCKDQFDASYLQKLFDDAGPEVEEKGRRGAKKWLVIIDDKASDRAAMQDPVLSLLYTQVRHRGGSILISTQSYMMVSKPVRTQATFIVFFAQPNAKEVETICNECCPVGMQIPEFHNMFTDITGEKYSCLVRHPTRPASEQYFKNFTEPIDLSKYIKDKRRKNDSNADHQARKWNEEHAKVKEKYVNKYGDKKKLIDKE